MTTPPIAPTLLTSGQKKILRSLGHHLEPVVHVGKEGVSDSLVKSAIVALKAHELVKVKLGQNCPLGREEAGELLSLKTGAQQVQIIGRMILLYRANPLLPEEKQMLRRGIAGAGDR